VYSSCSDEKGLENLAVESTDSAVVEAVRTPDSVAAAEPDLEVSERPFPAMGMFEGSLPADSVVTAVGKTVAFGRKTAVGVAVVLEVRTAIVLVDSVGVYYSLAERIVVDQCSQVVTASFETDSAN
jgi:hypothetical protein